ncbi:hypothetical protein Tco_0127302 [Tanacetum coccineum]
MSSYNQRECVGCGQPCDGFYCYLCTCQQCGVNLINGICLNCTYGDGKPVTCCGCEGPLNGGFCSFCASRAGNSFAYDPNPNSFDDSQNLSDYPPQPQYQTYSCELCGNDAHYERGKQAAQISTPYWKCPIFDDDDEYTIQYREYLENSSNAITPDLPTEEPDNSLSMGDEHLSTIPETESDEVIKSSVEDLVPIPSESEGISDDTCDVPFCDNSPPLDVLNDHFEIFSDFNDDCTSSDDDSFENIDYVEASPPDSELVSLEEVKDDILREKLLNINLLIAKIESLNDNPTPDCVLKSPSPFPIPVEDSDSFFEKSDTSLSYSDNSLPEFETFSDHTEETRSGSTTTHADNSLTEYDSFHFEIEPDQGELSRVVMETILGEPRVHVPNVLPTHPTLYQDSDFSPSDDSLGSDLEVSFPSGTRNKIFDPGISIEVQSKRFLSLDEISNSFIRLESTAKIKRPQPRSNQKNHRIPSVSKISCLSNNIEKVEEHHKNLQFFKTPNHMSSEGNDIKLAIRNEKCMKLFVLLKNQNAKVSNTANQKKHKVIVKKYKKLGSEERRVSPRPRKPRTCLRWLPTGRIVYHYGKITAPSNIESESDTSVFDNTSASNPHEPTGKGFPNSTSFLGSQEPDGSTIRHHLLLDKVKSLGMNEKKRVKMEIRERNVIEGMSIITGTNPTRISFDESDDEDYTIAFDKNSFSYQIISTNDLKMDLENDNEKVNKPLFPSPEPTVSCIDDLDFFKEFENEFPAIVYNDALMSKSDFSTEPTLCPQHIDKFDSKDETSLSEYHEVEQSVLYFNDLFLFNIVYLDDLKSDIGNDDNEIDMIQSLRANENTNKLLKKSHNKIKKNFIVGSFIMGLNVSIMAWNHFVNGMLFSLIKNLYVSFGIPFDPKLYYKDGDCARILRRPRYGYIKNHKKIIKNGQAQTRERRSVQKPKAKP